MNMLIRGVPVKCKNQIEKIARSKNLSVNQVMVELVVRYAEEGTEKEDADARQREAILRLRQMREEIRRKYGISNDSVRMIREDRDNR